MAGWAHEVRGHVGVDPEAIWRLWEDPGQWPRWNPGIASARMRGPLEAGATARIRFRGSLTPLTFRVVDFDRGRAFTDEAGLPGARLAHLHRVEPAEGGAEVLHRLELRGPLAGLWARLLGGRMRSAAEEFVEREEALARAGAEG